MASITGGYNSSSTSNAFQNTGTTTGSSNGSNLAYKTPDQTAAGSDIFAALHQYLSNPQAAVNPARMAARSQVNQNYSGLADRTRQQFLTTGGGGSGKSGQAIMQGELGRSSGLADADMNAQQQAAALPMTAAQLAEGFLGINMGSTMQQSGTSTTDQSGTSSGTSSGWGIGGSAGYSSGSNSSGPWSKWG